MFLQHDFLSPLLQIFNKTSLFGVKVTILSSHRFIARNFTLNLCSEFSDPFAVYSEATSFTLTKLSTHLLLDHESEFTPESMHSTCLGWWRWCVAVGNVFLAHFEPCNDTHCSNDVAVWCIITGHTHKLHTQDKNTNIESPAGNLTYSSNGMMMHHDTKQRVTLHELLMIHGLEGRHPKLCPA